MVDQIVRSSEQLDQMLELDQMNKMIYGDDLSLNSHYGDYIDWRDTFRTLGVLDHPVGQMILTSMKEKGMSATFDKMSPASRLAAVDKERSPYVRSSAKGVTSVAKSKDLALFFREDYGVLFAYGQTGSGKSTVAHRICQRFALGGNVWMYNCPPEKRSLFPQWYHHFDDLGKLSELPPGSIVIWDDATNKMSFIRTGDPMAEGAYTVTLRSGRCLGTAPGGRSRRVAR